MARRSPTPFSRGGASDGYLTVNNCPYVPTPVPGAWEPTPPGFTADPLQPCWGQLRPMVLTSGAECAPLGHPESVFNKVRFSRDGGPLHGSWQLGSSPHWSRCGIRHLCSSAGSD